MKRWGLLALVAALAGAGGCASSARYVEKRADGGVVAVADDSDAWPSYNRQEARKLIEQHVGPNYEIVEQKTVNTGRATRSSLPDTNERLNPRHPGSPAYRSASIHSTSIPEATQFRITYRRKDGPADLAEVAPARATGTAPNVQPAGGAAPGVMASPFNRPTVPPAAGAPGCDT